MSHLNQLYDFCELCMFSNFMDYIANQDNANDVTVQVQVHHYGCYCSSCQEYSGYGHVCR